MASLTCDLDPDDEVLCAIQTILNAISLDRKNLNAIKHERDSLLSILKTFETERLSDDLLSSEMKENCRKRVKKESSKFNKSSESIITCNINDKDVSHDDLNIAFQASMCEDEVVGPTQFSPNKSVKILQEHNTTHNESKGRKGSTMKEKSPTVLSKYSSKKEHTLLHRIDSKDLSSGFQAELNQSSKWHSKNPTNTNTSRQLFKSRSELDSSISTLQPQKPNVRKKLGLNTTCLKQCTISFPKCEEETYCETISMQMNQKPSTSKIKTEPMDEQKEINESVIALTKNTNEVITVSESQATQEIYQHVLDNKNQSISDTQTGILRRSPRKLKYSSDECEACNEYHKKLGRDVEKNPPRKFGVCSKHHRNIHGLDTPRGFWNPKISDSDDEDTPYDNNFVKKH